MILPNQFANQILQKSKAFKNNLLEHAQDQVARHAKSPQNSSYCNNFLIKHPHSIDLELESLNNYKN